MSVGEFKDILAKRIDFLEGQIRFFSSDFKGGVPPFPWHNEYGYNIGKWQALTSELKFIREELLPKFLIG